MKSLKTILAVFFTIAVLAGLGVGYVVSSHDFFPGIPDKSFFGITAEDVGNHADIVNYQNHNPETDDYDADLIRRGEEAEERSRERAQQFQEEVLDGAEMREPDEVPYEGSEP